MPKSKIPIVFYVVRDNNLIGLSRSEPNIDSDQIYPAGWIKNIKIQKLSLNSLLRLN